MAVVVEIVTMPEHPVNGDTVRWQVVFVNTGAEAVRVPAEAVANVEVEAFRMAPNTAYHRGYGISTTVADTLAWTTMAPGERLVAEGEACAACATGTWAIEVLGPRWKLAGAAPDQVLPELPDRSTFAVASRMVAVEGGLEATMEARRDGKAVSVDITVENTSAEPLWVAHPDWWFVTCSYAYTMRNGKMGAGGQGGNIDNWTPLAEDRAVVLQPHGTLQIAPQRCEADVRRAVEANISITLRPAGAIEPIGASDVVRAFTGRLEGTASVRP